MKIQKITIGLKYCMIDTRKFKKCKMIIKSGKTIKPKNQSFILELKINHNNTMI